MRQFICGRFIDKFIISSRYSKIGAKISREKFEDLLKRSKDNLRLPNWAKTALAKLGYVGDMNQGINDILFIRQSGAFHYGKASYEITEQCNYRCQHCYLGKRSSSGLTLIDKKKIIDAVALSGAMWLQITGGEPLIDRDFIEIYEYAHSRGLLINLSTNGSLLTRARNTQILLKRPPYRIAISAYGATASCYEELTQSEGSFNRFMEGLTWLSKSGIRTRLNIIATRFNEAEIDSMVRIAKNFGFEHHVFSELTPSLDGNCDTSSLAGSCNADSGKQEKGQHSEISRCHAGRNFFHINALGLVHICKISRDHAIDILSDGVAGLNGLKSIADKALARPPICRACQLAIHCRTCSPMLRLYEKAGEIPSHLCPTLNSSERK